ncbi:glutathione S-transferase N-terminal domain-containing protein [Sphingobium scionense]
MFVTARRFVGLARPKRLFFHSCDKGLSLLADNPLGIFPLLVDGAVCMSEFAAICHYLATIYGGGQLARTGRTL